METQMGMGGQKSRFQQLMLTLKFAQKEAYVEEYSYGELLHALLVDYFEETSSILTLCCQGVLLCGPSLFLKESTSLLASAFHHTHQY